MPVCWVIGLAIYMIALLLASLMALVQLWPETPTLSDQGEEVRVLWVKATLRSERRVLLMVLFAGICGAALNDIWGLAYEVQQNRFAANLLLTGLVRPWIGCTVAIIFYGLLRGGVGFIGAFNSIKEVNVYGTAGIAGLVGFLAPEIAGKLSSAILAQ